MYVTISTKSEFKNENDAPDLNQIINYLGSLGLTVTSINIGNMTNAADPWQ